MIKKELFTFWISDKPLPDNFKRCIDTWHKVMPDYKISVLGIDDIEHDKYIDRAIAVGQFYLCSDISRITYLLKNGGIYLDCDVEVIKRFDPLLDNPCFLGMEDEENANGAVIGAEPNSKFLQDCLERHKVILETMDFRSPMIGLELGPRTMTKMASQRGFMSDRTRRFPDVTVYSSKYFYPYSYKEEFSPECITDETVAIHHWTASWKGEDWKPE